MRFKFLSIIFILFLVCNTFAQPGYVHPELEWYTIKTEHFEIHFHEGAERSAKVTAKIAEEIYQPICSLYDYYPDGTIHFIIKDHDDNSNGAAYYYDNKVEIWAPQMTFILRGTNSWLRNVITHEFAHMISLGAARKITRKIPAVYLQYMHYEDEKRPDVLYGYPDRIVSYPVAMTVAPMWLAEGMAQFQTPGLDYDRWDSHRDMLIRTAVLKGEMHSYDEMGVFGKNSLGNERTYNAGYAFTRYLTQNYGTSVLKQLTDGMKKINRVSIDATLKEATGQEAKELYHTWRTGLDDYYVKRLETIAQNRVEGKILTPKGMGNTFPIWSPDGTKIAFSGSKKSDYLSLTSLVVYDTKTEKTVLVEPGVNGFVTWSGNDSLIYAKNERRKHHSRYFDLYIKSVKKGKEKQLTKFHRVWQPGLSPDASLIVAVKQKDGTDDLVLIDAESGDITKILIDGQNGDSFYGPNWSADGKKIVFAQAREHGRDVKIVDVETGSIKTVVGDQQDARDAVFGPDGRIWFSWDKTGIFNIYSVNQDGSDLKLWTNVTGGAFMPTVSKDGKLAFSNFQFDGYKISFIEKPVEIDPAKAVYKPAFDIAPELLTVKETDPDTLKSLREYDDTILADYEYKPYEMTYSNFTFLPRVMIDSGLVKLGTYFYASDVLDRYSILGGVALNKRMDLDAFAMAEYRALGPTLFLELYSFARNVRRNIEVIEDYPQKANVDIGFNILEADIGAEFSPFDAHKLRLAFVTQRYTSEIKKFMFKGLQFSALQNTYFIGNHFTVKWNYNGIVPRVNSRISPSYGRKFDIQYNYELNDFFDDFRTDNEYSTPVEQYVKFNYHKVSLNWHEYLPNPLLKNHALTMNFQGGWIDRPVDSFFNYFAGGMPGLRGYPFYAIEGRKLMVGRFTYRFPLLSHWQKRFFNVTTDKVYMHTFFDYGNAFNKDSIDFSEFKKSVGLGARFTAFSFYGFPTAFSVEAAYGLDTFYNEEFHSKYGKEWRYYFGLLFDFID